LVKAKAVCPLFNRLKVSKLKVEKVLKPPQKPVTTKSFHVELRRNLSGNKYIKKPNTSVAKRLEKKVT
jgi:hypothetical protein